ncbi:MAG: tRNA pseudouridine(55) synthase TruB [Candidatus Dormibacteria bacterium]
MVGLLNLDKPAGLSSAQAIARLRHSSGERRVGHGGTLDPAATGVLPVFFGRATVLAERLSSQGKAYLAGVRFGAESDTDDAEGRLELVPTPGLEASTVAAMLLHFVGQVTQAPPAFSAIKLGGRRSYALARQAGLSGAAMPAPAERPVRVDALRLISLIPGEPGPLLTLELECGPGYYVRSLARDLGRVLGGGAHLESLVRTRVGSLRLEDAISLEAAQAAGIGLARALLPARAAAAGLVEVMVGRDSVVELRHGRALPAPGAPDGPAAAIDDRGHVLAIGRVVAAAFLPRRLVEVE